MAIERRRTAGMTDDELVALRNRWKPLEQLLQGTAVLGFLVAACLLIVAATSFFMGDLGQGIPALVTGVALVLGCRWAWMLHARARVAMAVAIVAWGVFLAIVGVLSVWSWLPFVVGVVPLLPFFSFVMSAEYREVVVPKALVREPTRFV